MFLLFISCFLSLFGRLANQGGYVTLIFSLFPDRRRASLRFKDKLKHVSKFSILPKVFLLIFLLVCLHYKKSCIKTPKNLEVTSLEYLLVDSKLSEAHIGRMFHCYALSKTKHVTNKYFFFFLILLSGDVNLNPGPVRHPCSSCLKPVAKNHRAVLCDSCDLWAHIKCENISITKYQNMMLNDNLSFVCRACLNQNLPFPEGNPLEEDFSIENLQFSSTQKEFQFPEVELLPKRGLKIAHLNTNGLLSKLDFLKIMMHKYKFDVLCISESKLDTNILDSEIKIDGYELFRLDRNRHGGGVLFYVNEQLESHLLKHQNISDHEALWIKVCLKKTKPLFLCVVYRPPASTVSALDTTSNLCSYLENCVKNLPQEKEVFILGDFNCNMLTKNALCSKIKDLCSQISFKQLVEEPTRVTKTSSSLLDLILSNSAHISKTGVFDFGISDHSLVYVVRKFKRPKLEPKIIRVRTYKNFNDEEFLRDLRLADWSYFYNLRDLDTACDIFNNNIKNVAQKHAPFISIKVKGKPEAWVTKEFLTAINERNFLLKQAKKSKSIKDWHTFTQKRNQVIKMKNKLKQSHYNETLSQHEKRPKQLWKILKSMVPNKNNKDASIKRLVQDDGSEITCPKGIADHFNKFFVNVGVSLASKFSSDTSKINPPVNEKKFNFKKVSVNSVKKQIFKLKNGKATGLDEIGTRLLKAGSPLISVHLAKIFNKSLKTGYVPKCWKTKRVSPLHKGESKTDCNNFRPISILPIPMKIFEKIVHDQVSEFIKESEILSDRQSGFRRLFSTSTAVLDVSDYILEQLDDKKFVGAVLIDLKKAFDTVDHKILLKKLWCYGIQSQSFNWFQSYLNDRQQLTLVNNIQSDLLQEDVYGVPQGSVLGPLLFLLYINDLKSVIQNSYCHLYADDTIIIQSASDPDSLIESLERELERVDFWLNTNKMTINTKKTEVIFFGYGNKLKKLDNKTVRYLDTPLKCTDSVKYLGVIFDEKMQWSKHIKNITQKVNLKLGKIRSIAHFLTWHTKKLLTNALVMPYFHYCSPAWSSAAPFRLKQVDKKVVSACSFLGDKQNYTFSHIFSKDISILTFKALKNIAPKYMSDKISLAKNCHNYNTRRALKNHLQIPSANTKFGQRTFAFRASKIWNDLPNDFSYIESLLQFKTSVKLYIEKQL